jgi:glycerol-3-phosphate cytidylyltransferase-like family protein
LIDGLTNNSTGSIDMAVRKIQSQMAENKRYNRNIKKNLDYLVQNCPDETFTLKDKEGNELGKYSRLDIVNKLLEVNRVIVSKINNTNLECMEDVGSLFYKLGIIRKGFKEDPLYSKCQKASNVNYYLEDNDERTPLRYLNDISVSDIPGILQNFDSLIKFINRL